MAPATTTAMPQAVSRRCRLAARRLRRPLCAARRGAPARRPAAKSSSTGVSGVQSGKLARARGRAHRHRRTSGIGGMALHRAAPRSRICAAARRLAHGRRRRAAEAARATAARERAGRRARRRYARRSPTRRWRAAAPDWRRRRCRAHAAERRGRARRNRRARRVPVGRNAALVEHHAFDGAVGLVVRAAGHLRDGQPQLFEIDRVVDGPLHLERREARA